MDKNKKEKDIKSEIPEEKMDQFQSKSEIADAIQKWSAPQPEEIAEEINKTMISCLFALLLTWIVTMFFSGVVTVGVLMHPTHTFYHGALITYHALQFSFAIGSASGVIMWLSYKWFLT